MSSNGIITTIVGRAATAPREIHGGKVPYTSFRMATAERYYDKAKGAWVEGRTEWLTVKVFRDMALNVAVSVCKGQPLVVYGRLKTEEWVGEHGPRTGLVLEAAALGHDLTRGRATFVRTQRRPADDSEAAETASSADRSGADGSGASGADTEPPDGADEAASAADPWAIDALDPRADPVDGIDGAVEGEELALTP